MVRVDIVSILEDSCDFAGLSVEVEGSWVSGGSVYPASIQKIEPYLSVGCDHDLG